MNEMIYKYDRAGEFLGYDKFEVEDEGLEMYCFEVAETLLERGFDPELRADRVLYVFYGGKPYEILDFDESLRAYERTDAAGIEEMFFIQDLNENDIWEGFYGTDAQIVLKGIGKHNFGQFFAFVETSFCFNEFCCAPLY